MSREVKAKRPYTSQRRAQAARETKERIGDAALEAFRENGYTTTTIEDIAEAAGVAPATVYKVFGSKREILRTVVHARMAGDPAGGDVMKQDWWREQIGETDPVRQLALISRNARDIYQRAGDVIEVVFAAAASDEEIRDLRDDIEQARVRRSRTTARSLQTKPGARRDLGRDVVADVLWSLTAPELYLRLVNARRWSRDAYQRWLTEMLCSALLTR